MRLDKFEREIAQVETVKNIEIKYIIVSREYAEILKLHSSKYKKSPRRDYKNILPTEEGKLEFLGYWEGHKLFQTLSSRKFNFDYKIVKRKLYPFCPICHSAEMYDSKKDTYYCSFCLQNNKWKYRIRKLKRKAKNYLP